MQEPPGKGGFMDLSMKQTQQQMEQSVRILQMDSFQLTDYIKEVMLENPVLDMEPPKERGQALALKKMQWLEDQAKREQENTGYYEEEEDESLLEKTAAAPRGNFNRAFAVPNCHAGWGSSFAAYPTPGCLLRQFQRLSGCCRRRHLPGNPLQAGAGSESHCRPSKIRSSRGRRPEPFRMSAVTARAG